MIKVRDNERVFFVGDIHGNFDNLQKAIKKNKIKEDDCLIFLGDLINKGKESLKVLEFVKKWKNKAIILGNHERVFIDYVIYKNTHSYNFLMAYGGTWIKDVKVEDLKKWGNYLENNSYYFLEFKIEDKVIGCCHASVPFDDWELMKDNFQDVHSSIIWDFSRFNYFEETKKAKKIKNIDGVIFGHVPVPKIKKIRNTLYIDTGSYFIDYDKFIMGNITFLEIRKAKKLLFR